MTTKKIALVTAGASGIGKAIALAFSSGGYDVHVCDVSAEMVEKITKEAPGITATCADAASSSDMERVFQDLESAHGALDVLVNNVGIAGPTAPVEDIEPSDWERTIAVDLNAHFYATRKAVPMLKSRGGGSIVNIASNAALFGFPLRSPYTASKWAMLGLTKTWAMELGVHGIRVNALCPGSVNGPRIDAVINRDAAERGMMPDEIRNVYQRQSSMRVFVEAEDVANMALFLASDAGRFVSGQAIAIDGHTEGLTNWLDA